MNSHDLKRLRAKGPCREGLLWALTQPSLAACWDNCKRAGWMFWMLERFQPLTQRQAVRITLALAEEAGKVYPEHRTKEYFACIRTAKNWLARPNKANRFAAARAGGRLSARAPQQMALWGAPLKVAWELTTAVACGVRYRAEWRARSAVTSVCMWPDEKVCDILRKARRNPFRKPRTQGTR